MWRQLFILALAVSARLFGQDCGCYIPDGQVIYSEMCCPTDLCPPECPEPCSPFPVLLVDIQAGVRRDMFKISVEGPDGIPNNYIHQSYKKVKSAFGSVNFWVQTNRQWYFRGYADYAKISGGKETLEIHNAAGHEIYHHKLRAKNGHMYDFLGGVGYVLPFCPKFFTVALAGGYSREGQYIKANGNRGRLQASWTGPWAGTDVAFRSAGVKVGGTFEYHWASFRATGHQVPDDDCVGECDGGNRFRSNGRGLVGVLSVTQIFCDDWRFGFVGKAQWWRTHKGTYSLDGENLRLKKVQWNSFSITADLGYRF